MATAGSFTGYKNEPDTKGEVILHTNFGPLQIALWSKEAPKACRNFVQNCLEGYYDNTTFHRIIKDFMIQGGDPTGTGNTCESIYGEPFPLEIHGRLQFRQRGMMGVANAGKHTKTNGSQFFFTLGPARDLDKVHTLFAKVAGNTLYNLTKMAEVETDAKTDRPLAEDPSDLPRITHVEVTHNPFDDIEIRGDVLQKNQLRKMENNWKSTIAKRKEEELQDKKIQVVKNKNVLALEDSDEEESDSSGSTAGRKKEKNATTVASAAKKFKIRSAHDMLEDERLLKKKAYENVDLSQNAALLSGTKMAEGGGKRKRNKHDADSSDASSGSRSPGRRNKAGEGIDSEEDSDLDAVQDAKQKRKQEEQRKRQQKIDELKQGIQDQFEGNGKKKKEKKKKKSDLLLDQFLQDEGNKATKGIKRNRGGGDNLPGGESLHRNRGGQTSFNMLAEFEKRLKNAKRIQPTRDENGNETKKNNEENGVDDEDDAVFGLTGGLKFHTSADKAFKLAEEQALRAKQLRERRPLTEGEILAQKKDMKASRGGIKR
ncbi:unnamed protein product [Amoebophrya sp. A120]|nr:unnamed protein product [Amoebophrya sp. A120]|eukprot:GSA120T00008636001.1